MRNVLIFGMSVLVGVGLVIKAPDFGIDPLHVLVASLAVAAAAWLLLPDDQPKSIPLPPEELKRNRKAAIRELIEDVEPPLSEAEALEACHQVYRALVQGRGMVKLRFGERRFRVNIEPTPAGDTKLSLFYIKDSPCS